MGKLAERFPDANRSGVYRVRAAEVPRAAALEASAHLVEVGARTLSEDGAAALHRSLPAEDVRMCVLILTDATSLGAEPRGRALAALGSLANAWREAGRSFFAVLVDPHETLALPPLYREKPDSGINE
jgi:hypothetical protein